MTKIIRTAFLWFRSDNLKSKIKNLKSVGLATLIIAFVICGVAVEAQQPARIPRIGILAAPSASFFIGPGRSISPTAARAWVCRREKRSH